MGSWKDTCSILAFSCTSCVALSKWLDLSELQFPTYEQELEEEEEEEEKEEGEEDKEEEKEDEEGEEEEEGEKSSEKSDTIWKSFSHSTNKVGPQEISVACAFLGSQLFHL